jgi:signal transduction histidine kinase
MVPGRRPISVLLVEDNPDHVHLIERRLRDGGVEVRRAFSGKEALEALDGVDLVLLDYRLPDMSGLETLQEIRRLDGPSVVMVTGMGSEEIAVEAMRAGAIDYVVKDNTYLRMLPEVVERAWRLHDLSRRSKQLQRLALVVNSAQDREAIFSEIVKGARALLGAVLCALLLHEDGGLEVVAQDGSGGSIDPLLIERALKVSESGVADVDGGTLLLPLSRDEEALGLLVVDSGQRRFLDEEVDLADTFASFSVLALRNLRRRELEQRLISELQQTLELRRDFINSISHELRTPLACISGFASTILTHWGKLDNDTIHSSVQKIQHHGSDLTNLVEKLLDFSFMEQGRFATEMTTLRLREHIESSVGDLTPLLASRPIELELEDVQVTADPNLLHRVMSNLISNAVKASSADDPLTIRAYQLDGVARVEVKDVGTGLSAEDAGHVFDPFWRSRHAIKAAQRGSGIGLTLVKEYVRTMGGDVGVTSELGSGSTFYFSLPVANE